STGKAVKETSWREWTAELLESPRLHKQSSHWLVPHLLPSSFSVQLPHALVKQVLIDSACVLADLGYTFLKESLWLAVLSHISLAITTFFLVEIPLTIWAQGWTFYKPGGQAPHSSLHFFDAVVCHDVVLEVVLRGRERELAGLLIISDCGVWMIVALADTREENHKLRLHIEEWRPRPLAMSQDEASDRFTQY
ncbi:uncharacterized protein B0H18DRAFT_977551, partial [Fomitopsis serialis]|uniref:uncharacterized protein n=1 Tax=Fomitopsis serialis TaxID=139415 RepID=UPI00200867E5